MFSYMRLGVPIPAFTGHLNAMTALARRLQSRGHDVVCFGIPDCARGVEAAGLPFETIGEGAFPPGSIDALTAEVGKLSGMDVLKPVAAWYRKSAVAEMEETPALLERLPMDGLVVDYVCNGVGAVAMATNTPFVNVACTPLIDTSGVAPLCAFPWPHEDSEAARVRNRIGVAGYLQVINSIRAPILEYLESNGVTVDTSDPDWQHSRLAYLTQVPAAFDFPGDHLPAHYHRTGPFHDGTGRVPVAFPWERLTGEPLIYASMGTIMNGMLDVFRTILKAVERSGYQLVLSVGTSIDPAALQPVRPETIILQRAPQLDLLKQAALCVTHAGLNTTLEALAQGVPLVAIPVAGDQPGVAARILASGTGLFLPLPELSVDSLRALVDEVLATPSYRERALAMKSAIEQVDGLTMAAEIIERAFAKP
jgi:MGT family glycosyltransferase